MLLRYGESCYIGSPYQSVYLDLQLGHIEIFKRIWNHRSRISIISPKKPWGQLLEEY